MNSRTQEILNRIELVAMKLKMTVEEAVSILEGKHPDKKVADKTAPLVLATKTKASVADANTGDAANSASTGITKADA